MGSAIGRATSFSSFCSPGVGGVIACPCSNPPSGPGRGCNNSSGTGGAILSASGGSYLSSDSLVFTTTGERPIAVSTVMQWTGGSSAGAVFAMGVRCTSGTFKRLYVKSAVGGSITAPNFGLVINRSRHVRRRWATSARGPEPLAHGFPRLERAGWLIPDEHAQLHQTGQVT